LIMFFRNKRKCSESNKMDNAKQEEIKKVFVGRVVSFGKHLAFGPKQQREKYLVYDLRCRENMVHLYLYCVRTNKKSNMLITSITEHPDTFTFIS